jgi:hypothetical protein
LDNVGVRTSGEFIHTPRALSARGLRKRLERIGVSRVTPLGGRAKFHNFISDVVAEMGDAAEKGG